MRVKIVQKTDKNGNKIPKRYQIIVDLGRDPITGKRIRKKKTVHGTKRDAENEQEKFLEQLRKRHLPDVDERLTVSQLLDRWLEHVNTYRDPGTHDYYEYCSKRIREALGRVDLQQLRRRHVQDFLDSLNRPGARRDGREGPLSPRTVKMHQSALHAALSYAQQMGYIETNPAANPILPAQATKEKTVLTMEQIRILLKAAEGTRWYPIIYIAVHTGLRNGEILGLKWDDIDWDEPAIFVQRSLNRKRTSRSAPYLGDVKTHEKRIVYLRPEDVEVLEDHRNRQQVERAIASSWEHPDHVFTRDDGSWIYPTSPNTMLHKIIRKHNKQCEQAGQHDLILPEVTMHELRHTHGSQLLAAGWDIASVSERLGHRNIQTTIRVYIHALPGAQKRNMDKYLS